MKKLKPKTKITLAIAGVIALAGIVTGSLLVINGDKGVKVDDFVGKEKKVVETWRKENDIEKDHIKYTYTYDEKLDEDFVIKQSIKGGETMKPEDTLVIQVSDGADPTKKFALPDFTGKQEDEIQDWFKEHKFSNVVYTYEVSDEVESGGFISMDPEAGTEVMRGDTVNVIIAKDASDVKEIKVPDFTSMSRSEIQKWATDNKVTVTFTEKASDSVSKNCVIEASVQKNSIIKEGDKIEIVISSGKANEKTSNESPIKSPEDNASHASQNTQNSSVASKPSGGGSSSNGQVTGPQNSSPAPQPQPAPQPEPTPQPQPQPAPQPQPEAPTYTVPNIQIRLFDGMSSSEIRSKIDSLISRSGIPGQVTYREQIGDIPGVASISPVSGTTIHNASEIVVVINVMKG